MHNDFKIVIINGINDEMDGKIEKIYSEDENSYHVELLTNYIQINYPPNDEIKNLDYSSANSLSLFLREQGKVVFINSTSYKKQYISKYGKSGILILPNQLSEKQIAALNNFKNDINDFDDLQAWYDFSDHTSCKMVHSKTKGDVGNVIDFVINNRVKNR